MSNLRQRIQERRTVWAAGAYDALSARLIEEAGFDALLTTGFGISSSFLAEPDAELYTMTENLTVVRNVCNAVRIPVIADIDTAYSNAINAMRTMREFEATGVSAVIMEDQEAPKRCPACTDSITIIPLEEGVAKVKALVAARQRPDTVIVARTDAMIEEEAVRRAKAYVAAGADLIQPISKCFKDIASLRRLRKACGVPLSLQLLGWLERDLDRRQIEEVAGLATFPLVPLMTATQALRNNLKVLCDQKSSKALPHAVMDHLTFTNFIGFPRIEALQREFLLPAAPAAQPRAEAKAQ